jgi:hypothetical protein
VPRPEPEGLTRAPESRTRGYRAAAICVTAGATGALHEGTTDENAAGRGNRPARLRPATAAAQIRDGARAADTPRQPAARPRPPRPPTAPATPPGKGRGGSADYCLGTGPAGARCGPPASRGATAAKYRTPGTPPWDARPGTATTGRGTSNWQRSPGVRCGTSSEDLHEKNGCLRSPPATAPSPEQPGAVHGGQTAQAACHQAGHRTNPRIWGLCGASAQTREFTQVTGAV